MIRLFPVWVFFCVSAACSIAATPLVVFPGAQGFGTHTSAGRGGAVIKVTTLAATGEGSLREAAGTEGPRTVVFEVAGVIDLGGRNIGIDEPYLTIAGETAPSPGITIIGGGITVASPDVLICHIRVRPGDKHGKRWRGDAINVGHHQRGVSNVVIDHCSFSWAIDEVASVSGKPLVTRDITFSNCIIAEGLSHSLHGKGEHSKGSLIHDGCRNVSILRNLYAHNRRRNPYLKSDTRSVVCNNLVYNPGRLALHISNFDGASPLASIVGNVMISGPSTPDRLGLIATLGKFSRTLYRRDNLAFDRQRRVIDVLVSGGAPEIAKWSTRQIKWAPLPAVWCPGMEPPERLPEPGESGEDEPELESGPRNGGGILASSKVEEHVLANAGARPADRDAVDRRIVESVRSGTGRVIDSQDDVGGYPDPQPIARAQSLPKDPNGDEDGDGYTNLEEWLHRLAGEVAGSEP